MWRGQIFGTPPEPHFNLPSAALAPELLNEWLSVLAEENANHIAATPKKKVQTHNNIQRRLDLESVFRFMQTFYQPQMKVDSNVFIIVCLSTGG